MHLHTPIQSLFYVSSILISNAQQILPALNAISQDNTALGFGYDIVTQSVKNQIVSYTSYYNWTNPINNVTYQVPTNIDITVNDILYVTQEYLSFTEITDFMQFHYDITSFEFFTVVFNYFHNDISVMAQNMFSSESNLVFLKRIEYNFYQLEFNPFTMMATQDSPLYLALDFFNDEQIISSYGLMFPYRCVYGGVFEVIIQISLELQVYMAGSLQNTLDTVFTIVMGVIGNVGDNLNLLLEIDPVFRQNATITVMLIGGNPLTLFSGNMESWNQTIINQPSILTCDYFWIYDVVQNQTRQQSLQATINNYISNATVLNPIDYNLTSSCGTSQNSFTIDQLLSEQNTSSRFLNSDYLVSQDFNTTVLAYTYNYSSGQPVFSLPQSQLQFNVLYSGLTCLQISDEFVTDGSIIAQGVAVASGIAVPFLPLPVIGILFQDAFLNIQAEINALFNADIQMMLGVYVSYEMFEFVNLINQAPPIMKQDYAQLTTQTNYTSFIQKYGSYYMSSISFGFECFLYVAIDLEVKAVLPPQIIEANAKLALCILMNNYKIKLALWCVNYYVQGILQPMNASVSGYFHPNITCSGKSPSPMMTTQKLTHIIYLDPDFNDPVKNSGLLNATLNS